MGDDGSQVAAALAEALVGREAELKTLDLLTDGLAAGVGGAIVLLGEPGIGKTRLLGELERIAQQKGFLTIRGRAAEFESGVPFAIFADWFASLAQALPGRDEPASAEFVARLSDILSPGPMAKPQGQRDERYYAHRGMRDVLERVAGDRPVVVLLDDVHWADEASTALLSTLLHRPPQAPVLLALACRARRLGPVLTGALSSAEAIHGAVRLELGPLGEHATDRWLGELCSPDRRRWLFQESGGNPFYLQQLALHEAVGFRSEERQSLISVPSAVADSLAGELDALGGPAGQLLRAAAVAGNPFDVSLAGDALDLESDSLLNAVDDILATGIVRATEATFEFEFRHPLVCRVVYESIPAGQRTWLHTRVERALARRGAKPIARAGHLERSAGPGDQDAIAILTEAGYDAMQHAPVRAARWLAAAARLVPQGAAFDAQRGELLQARAHALDSAGDFREAAALLRQALDIGGQPVAQRIELVMQLALVEFWLSRDAVARRMLEDALRNPQGVPDAHVAYLEVILAAVLSLGPLWCDMDVEACVANGERALAVGRSRDEPVIAGSASAFLALTHAQAGNVTQAHQLRAQAYAIFDDVSPLELGGAMESLLALVWTDGLLAECAAQLELVRRMIALSEDTGRARLFAGFLGIEQNALRLMGRGGELAQGLDAMLDAARITVDPVQRHWSLLQGAWSLLYLGDLSRASLAANEAAELSRSSPYALRCKHLERFIIGLIRLESGDARGGYELMLREAGGPTLGWLVPIEQVIGCEYLAHALLACGDVDGAGAWVERAESIAARVAFAVTDFHALRARAQLSLAMKDFTRAADEASRAEGIAAQLGLGPDMAIAAYYRALALIGRAPSDEGAAAMVDVEARFVAMGCRRWAERSQQALRTIGYRLSSRRHQGASGSDPAFAGLTGRELQVARLVADHLTNREVAQRLFLSQKTVEAHLRNVFAKLGVSSRGAVGSVIDQLPQDPD